LGDPSETLSVTLPLDNRAHEELNGPDVTEGNLALASRLVEAEVVPKLLLRNSAGGVNLVAENKEGNLGELFYGEKGIEFGLGFGKALEVGGVDEEDDSVNFREVVSPETTSLCVSAKVEGIESDVANGKFLPN